MNRRKFLINGAALSGSALIASSGFPARVLHSGINNPTRPSSKFSHRLPKSDVHYQATSGYVEDVPIPEYTWASDKAYEAFLDMKFGIRLHWGLYSITELPHESWPTFPGDVVPQSATASVWGIASVGASFGGMFF